MRKQGHRKGGRRPRQAPAAETWRIHVGFDVEGMLTRLKAMRAQGIVSEEADDFIRQFEDLKRQGVRVVSSCPQAREVEPGVWHCTCSSKPTEVAEASP